MGRVTWGVCVGGHVCTQCGSFSVRPGCIQNLYNLVEKNFFETGSRAAQAGLKFKDGLEPLILLHASTG